jgi:serine/threonine protein kinase
MHEEGTVVGGRYRLIRQVGEGGMATVWEAEHLALHSPVAVKFLHTGGRHSSELLERFLREARTAASVRHRNVIEITDFGLTDDKMPYMVLEYLQGQSLAQLMEHNPALDPTEAVRLVSLTLRGLAAVHDAGIVHRDLKPENIFLVSDADGTFPKLLDFGVSRRVGLASDITQEGALIGTPDYMSPEQARGDRDIDRRTDIYSMGVILYETLTGRLPFEAERIGEIIRRITTETPPTVADLRPDLPADLSAVVQRAMARDREDRFPDARAMRWAIIDSAEIYGFRHTNSALISVSELPPPPTDRDAPTGDVTLPRTQPLPDVTPSAGPRSDAASTRGGEPRGTDDGAAERRATENGAAKRRARIPLYVLLLVLAIAGGSSLYYVQGGRFEWSAVGGVGGPPAPADAPEGPQPWEPMAPGLPAGLFDAGVPDAEAVVELHLVGVPEGAVVLVDGVPMPASTALPVLDTEYQIEVHAPDAGLMWKATHPGSREGTYAVWPMGEEELAVGAPPPPEPARKTRRRPRRR